MSKNKMDIVVHAWGSSKVDVGGFLFEASLGKSTKLNLREKNSKS
jgi:hypothetical protein